ncbi:MAG TPA: hypothetical protein VIN59_02340 [Alphaproteobacteria bacterium]
MRLAALIFATTCLFAVSAQAVEYKPLFATTASDETIKRATNSVSNKNKDDFNGNSGLSEMPVEPFPTAAELLDADKDGIPDSEDKDIAIPNPFAPQDTKKDEPKKKQVYKGVPDTELRRSISDPRIDDGYVQGLIQQRAPN